MSRLAHYFMKKLQITRSSPNYDELVELYKNEKNAKLKVRYHTLVLMHEFQNCTTVAELVKKSRTTIQSWVTAFNAGGIEAILPKSPPGCPSRLSEDQKEELKTDILTHPRELGYEFSNWEGKNVSEHIKNKFGVLLKVRQCQYLLHELGFTLQCPTYKYPKSNLEKKKKFVRDFKKSWILLDQKI